LAKSFADNTKIIETEKFYVPEGYLRVCVTMNLPEGKEIKSFRVESAEEVKKEIENLGIGYLRLTVDYRGEFTDGYLVVEKGAVVAAYHQSDRESQGDRALDQLSTDIEKKPLVSVVEITPLQLDMVKEYYPETLVERRDPSQSPSPVEEAVEEQPVEEPRREEQKPPEKNPAPRAAVVPEARYREETLRKYGIKEPPDEMITSILFDYAIEGKNIKDMALDLRKRIEKGITRIPKIKKSCVTVTANRKGGLLEFIVNITSHYVSGLTGKRDVYLEEKMKEDLEKISRVMAGEISERLGIETTMRCSIDFVVKGVIPFSLKERGS